MRLRKAARWFPNVSWSQAGSIRTIAPIPGIGSGSGSPTAMPCAPMLHSSAVTCSPHKATGFARSTTIRHQPSRWNLPTRDSRRQSKRCEAAPAATSRIRRRPARWSRSPGCRTIRWKVISCRPRTLPAERLSSCAWAIPDIGRKNICSRWRVMPTSGECRCSPSIFSVAAAMPNSTRLSVAAIWNSRSAT